MSAPSHTPDARRASNSHVTECGPGENWQNDYDRTAADLSERFLKSRAQYADRPFLLYTGFMNPHFPLLCPREYFDRYYPDRVVLPHTRTEPCETQHPSIQQLRYWLRNEEPLDDATPPQPPLTTASSLSPITSSVACSTLSITHPCATIPLSSTSATTAKWVGTTVYGKSNASTNTPCASP